jgi:hypothetical protein
MSKKDYIALARVFHMHKNRFMKSGNPHRAYFCDLVESVCTELKQDNPRFSRGRFMEAVFMDVITGKRKLL